MNLLTLLRSALITYRDLSIQKKYVRQTIVPYLEKMESAYNGNFTPYQKQKILNSYCLFVPVILCQNFKKLLGQPYTDQDRKTATIAGLSTPVFDDLFDEAHVCLGQIQRLAFEPASAVPASFLEKVAQDVSLKMFGLAADIPAYLQVVKKILEIQVDTLRQFDPATSPAELERITREKAANSFNFYFVHLVGPITPALKEVFYYVSSSQQYCNDIIDIRKDSLQNIFTPANGCKDFTAFKQAFLENIRIQNRKIMKLPVPKKTKEHFCLVVNAISAAAVPALDILIKAEKERTGDLKWHEMDRKKIIFDFEKPVNCMRWFVNVYKLSHLI